MCGGYIFGSIWRASICRVTLSLCSQLSSNLGGFAHACRGLVAERPASPTASTLPGLSSPNHGDALDSSVYEVGSSAKGDGKQCPPRLQMIGACVIVLVGGNTHLQAVRPSQVSDTIANSLSNSAPLAVENVVAFTRSRVRTTHYDQSSVGVTLPRWYRERLRRMCAPALLQEISRPRSDATRLASHALATLPSPYRGTTASLSAGSWGHDTSITAKLSLDVGHCTSSGLRRRHVAVPFPPLHL